jgi:hypothetical protein
MTHKFKVGDQVEWNSEAGRVRGAIEKKITSEVTFKGYTVHASKEFSLRAELKRISPSRDSPATAAAFPSRIHLVSDVLYVSNGRRV